MKISMAEVELANALTLGVGEGDTQSRDVLEEWMTVEELELDQKCTAEEALRVKEAVGEKEPPKFMMGLSQQLS